MTSHPQSGTETERWYSDPFLLFVLSRTPVCAVAPPTVRDSLPSLVYLSGNKSLIPQELGSHGDSKSSQVDEEDEGPQRRPLYWELLSSHIPGGADTVKRPCKKMNNTRQMEMAVYQAHIYSCHAQSTGRSRPGQLSSLAGFRQL